MNYRSSAFVLPVELDPLQRHDPVAPLAPRFEDLRMARISADRPRNEEIEGVEI